MLLQLLHAHEKYDIDELGEDVLDQGYSPTNDSLPGNDPGVTAGESAPHGDLVHWLKRKVLEAGTPDEGDRLDDTIGTDGDLIDDQVRGQRVGSFPGCDTDGPAERYDDDHWAWDVGLDIGVASARRRLSTWCLAPKRTSK
ncbi:hypothetical protein [Streptomyces lannensis]|uniref:Uncharacterized protein n=1 Tax=Streptomyces lannensis TaxID=766498 RepID=A0ABP7LAR2_9ACTN